jgi:two-component system, cell cycle sensor histidine kinase and response regulator CckA
MENETEYLRLRCAELEKRLDESEKKRQESEDRFYKLFHASSYPIAISSIKDGRIVDLNEASAGMGGFTREELLGTAGAEINLWSDPKQRELVINKMREVGRIHDFEAKLRSKAGDDRTVLFTADPITMNDEPCLLCVIVDITARESAAKELRESEEKYRRLVENSLQGLAIVQDDRFVFCNSAFAVMTGYSIEELAAFPHSKDLVHPDDRETVYRRHQDRIAGRSVPPLHEHRIAKKDGSLRWMAISASLAEYNDRPAVQVVCMDITERREAENALRESNERFRLIAETINEIFWIFDVKNEALTYLSPAYERIWGHSSKHLIGSQNPFMDPVHPDDRERIAAELAKISTGQQLEYEFRIIRPDGSIRYLKSHGYPVMDETGKVKQYVGVEQDVTDWVLADEALKASKEYLNQIINCIGDPIFVKDREHRFVLVNDALCAFTGKTSEELLTKTSLETLPEDLARRLYEQEEEVFGTAHGSLTEDAIVDGKGNSRALLTKKSLLMDKEGHAQIVGVMRDITEYKHLEIQLLQSQKMEAIGVLAGGVAHDFNNLLNVINGYCELLLDELAVDDPKRNEIQQISQAGQRAASLTSQLLAFSRKQILQPMMLDLNGVISSMHLMLRRLIRENIDFVVKTQPDLGLVNADPGKVQQIVMNLAVNARDAMLEGGKLIIETANVDFDQEYAREHLDVKPGPYVMLAVSDNGLGMDETTKAHLFEPFYTTKGKGRGTGLGLSTVYGIVRQSNGYIWAYSEPGKGTTFKIYFPRAEGAIANTLPDAKSEQEIGGNETVLVAEDEPSVRELAVRILRNRGYTVLEASNGREALNIVRKYAGEIHLVLTDVIMPGMSGKDLISELTITRPGIKALYISGYTSNAIVHNGILDSDVNFLQKPFTIESLTRKVREAIETDKLP